MGIRFPAAGFCLAGMSRSFLAVIFLDGVFFVDFDFAVSFAIDLLFYRMNSNTLRLTGW